MLQPMLKSDHAPYQRIMSDETTAVDRQWSRMLKEVLEPVSLESMVRSGIHEETARDLLGLIAVHMRNEALGEEHPDSADD